jgi:hypothetical protein
MSKGNHAHLIIEIISNWRDMVAEEIVLVSWFWELRRSLLFWRENMHGTSTIICIWSVSPADLLIVNLSWTQRWRQSWCNYSNYSCSASTMAFGACEKPRELSICYRHGHIYTCYIVRRQNKVFCFRKSEQRLFVQLATMSCMLSYWPNSKSICTGAKLHLASLATHCILICELSQICTCDQCCSIYAAAG